MSSAGPGPLEPDLHGEYFLQELHARVTQLELQADQQDYRAAEGGTGYTPVDGVPGFDDLDGWVAAFFTQTFIRPLGGESRWCPRWREHPEAVLRLDALHRSWNALTPDPRMGLAVWMRDHLDHQLTTLLSARGPFALCTPDRHATLLPLATTTSQNESATTSAD